MYDGQRLQSKYECIQKKQGRSALNLQCVYKEENQIRTIRRKCQNTVIFNAFCHHEMLQSTFS